MAHKIDIFAQQNKQLVFLVGVPRSGTTWLQSMLAHHQRVGTSQESHVFNHFIDQALDSWEKMYQFEDGRGGVGLPAYTTREEYHGCLQRFLFDVFQHSDDFKANEFFVEKTPDHINHIEQILTLVPSAKIIYMQRNPADIIESLLAAGRDWGKHWAPRNIVSAARLVNQYRTNAEQTLAKVDDNQLLTVHYENFIQNPEVSLRQVLGFLKLTASKTDIQHMLSNKAVINRYGEFAKQSGKVVAEPKGFRRSKKGKLNWLQRLLVQQLCSA